MKRKQDKPQLRLPSHRFDCKTLQLRRRLLKSQVKRQRHKASNALLSPFPEQFMPSLFAKAKVKTGQELLTLEDEDENAIRSARDGKVAAIRVSVGETRCATIRSCSSTPTEKGGSMDYTHLLKRNYQGLCFTWGNAVMILVGLILVALRCYEYDSLFCCSRSVLDASWLTWHVCRSWDFQYFTKRAS